MRRPNEFVTIIGVTFVALLVWVFAANETRQEARLDLQVQFDVAGDADADWDVNPTIASVELVIDGSNTALRRAEQLVARPLAVTLPAEEGVRQVDLVAELRQPFLERSGATIVSAASPERLVELNRIVRGIPVRVTTDLPLIEIDGEVQVVPSVITASLPRNLLPADGVVEVIARPLVDVGALPEGQEHAVVVELVPVGPLEGDRRVTLSPSRAEIRFRVKSRFARITLPTVRVQIAGPAEDHDEYRIVIDSADRVIPDVTIEADEADIARIDARDVKIVALVHLSNLDKSRRVSSKPIAAFVAVFPDGRMKPVRAVTPTGELQREINLTIEERDDTPPS